MPVSESPDVTNPEVPGSSFDLGPGGLDHHELSEETLTDDGRLAAAIASGRLSGDLAAFTSARFQSPHAALLH